LETPPGSQNGSTKGTPEVIKAGTYAHDVGKVGVKETKEVVETPQDVGKEEEQPELQTELEEPQSHESSMFGVGN
jgi:hypothetical protein